MDNITVTNLEELCAAVEAKAGVIEATGDLGAQLLTLRQFENTALRVIRSSLSLLNIAIPQEPTAERLSPEEISRLGIAAVTTTVEVPAWEVLLGMGELAMRVLDYYEWEPPEGGCSRMHLREMNKSINPFFN